MMYNIIFKEMFRPLNYLYLVVKAFNILLSLKYFL